MQEQNLENENKLNGTEVPNVPNEAEQKILKLGQENHSLKSQLGNLQKAFKELQEKNLTDEERQKNKTSELEQKDQELAEREKAIKLKELELERQLLLNGKGIFKEFEEFIVLDEKDTKETINAKINTLFNKQEAFRTSLLKEYSISKAGEVKKSDKEPIEKKLADLGIVKEKSLGLDTL